MTQNKNRMRNSYNKNLKNFIRQKRWRIEKMHQLKIVLHEGHILYKSARATNHPFTDDIYLYLPNIMKDIDNNIDKLWQAIDHLVLIELLCSLITKEVNQGKPLCKGNGICPINDILKNVGLNHEIKVECDKNNDEENQVNEVSISMTTALFAYKIKELTNPIHHK